MGNNQKWLISFFENITPVQWFFIITGSITVLFIKLMMNYYDRANLRNFKKDAREGQKRTDIVKKP
ncbi:MAG: hypothetical protein ACKN9V_02395 [Pseudomonadota bacterium]